MRFLRAETSSRGKDKHAERAPRQRPSWVRRMPPNSLLQASASPLEDCRHGPSRNSRPGTTQDVSSFSSTRPFTAGWARGSLIAALSCSEPSLRKSVTAFPTTGKPGSQGELQTELLLDTKGSIPLSPWAPCERSPGTPSSSKWARSATPPVYTSSSLRGQAAGRAGRSRASREHPALPGTWQAILADPSSGVRRQEVTPRAELGVRYTPTEAGKEGWSAREKKALLRRPPSAGLTQTSWLLPCPLSPRHVV